MGSDSYSVSIGLLEGARNRDERVRTVVLAGVRESPDKSTGDTLALDWGFLALSGVEMEVGAAARETEGFNGRAGVAGGELLAVDGLLGGLDD